MARWINQALDDRATSYREEDHGYSQGDGHQHCQTYAQDEDIQRVHSAVHVEELCFHGD